MDNVKQLLQAKGHDVWGVSPHAPVYEALTLMAEKNIGAVLVLDGEKVVGIVSERDYARKVVLAGRTSRETPVREIMTRDVLFVRPERSLRECMALMTGKRVRHLPVLEGDRLVGVVSIGDVVKAIISEQQFLIHLLEDYIRGG